SGEDGTFSVTKVQPGTYVLKASLLGYVDLEQSLKVDRDISGLTLALTYNTLALEGVTVTASYPKDGTGTTHNIGRDALNHLQLSNMSDMLALLPGGKTVNPDLTAATELTVRGGGSGAGNAAFGTAVEVNGVRMGDNAAFGGLAGVDTRSLQVENIESVEVVSGVPSAEYGDLGSGMVRVTTRKGRTPVQATFSVNP
ncbi:TonB-dependent receptor plug domain-containing protein, partial [Vibrio sp. FNV 38]|nr:TonB-dependent receptor plug domain-containing protein [Vibrio sp. FNV 38]